jgi:thioredoxin-related protein
MQFIEYDVNKSENRELAIKYRVRGVPKAVLLDKDGLILDEIYGYHEIELWEELFNKYL